jgi:hypothetical protein
MDAKEALAPDLLRRQPEVEGWAEKRKSKNGHPNTLYELLYHMSDQSILKFYKITAESQAGNEFL